MGLSEIAHVLKKVFSQPEYLLLSLLTAMIVYIINVVIANIQNLLVWIPELGLFQSLVFIKELITGFHRTVTLTTTVSIVLISICTGILLSLIVCKFKMSQSVEKPTGIISGIGLFLGFLVPGCAACGVGLVTIIGLGSSVAALPLQGTEIALLSVILLLVGIIKVSNDFYKCEIVKKQRKNR
ncbi:MAG: hypothetical protein AABY00_04175 [Nanoarchaeota archaeon]